MVKVLTQRTVEFGRDEVLKILMREALKALDQHCDTGVNWKISWAEIGGAIKVTLSEKDAVEKRDA